MLKNHFGDSPNFLQGISVLDLACGDGHYSRMYADLGAERVCGVDLSAGMIELARESESINPKGIVYFVGDAADPNLDLGGPYDMVSAIFLTCYAQDTSVLDGMASTISSLLKPGGVVIGFADNPMSELEDYGDSFVHFGILRDLELPRQTGSVVRYTIINSDKSCATFNNYWQDPNDYNESFAKAGLRLEWFPLVVDMSEDPIPNESIPGFETRESAFEYFARNGPVASFMAFST